MSDTVDSSPDNTTSLPAVNRNPVGRPRLKMVAPGDAPETEKTTPVLEKPKLSPAQQQAQLVQYLARATVGVTTPSPLRGLVPYPYDIRVFRSRREDDPILAEIIKGTAHLTLSSNVAANLATHCSTFAGFDSCLNITLPTAERIVQWFTYMERPLLPLPPSWGFKNQEGICFNRLDYDPEPVPNRAALAFLAPTFYEMLTRTTNNESFCARLGSQFFEKASRKQAGCLYGKSGGGKSQLEAILRALLGNAVGSFKTEDFEDKFIMAEFIDKRTAVVEECEAEFYQSKWFKIFTGARKVRIRRIHTQGCPGEINTILWTVSNEEPEIPNDPALKNRIIPWEVTPIEDHKKLPELEVHRRLKDEACYIAGYCIRIYQEMCPNHEEIPYDKEIHLQPLIDEYEAESLEVFENNFVWGPGYDMPLNVFNDKCKRLGISDTKAFRKFIVARFPTVNFKAQKKYGLKNTKIVAGIRSK